MSYMTALGSRLSYDEGRFHVQVKKEGFSEGQIHPYDMP